MIPEQHLVHAVAVFSELGIATAAVLLADLPKWRGLIKAAESDPIEVENLKVQAKKLGRLLYWVNCIAARVPSAAIQYSLPFIAFFFGILAVVGISHVPMRPFTAIDAMIGPDIETFDLIYWWMAFASFCISMLAVVVERTSAKVVAEADRAKDTPLDELPSK